MHYHILLTESCNGECKYCYKKSLEEFGNSLNDKFKFDFSSPEHFSVDIEKLKKFIQRDKNAVIVFYGGEPLLEINIIKQIIDNIYCKFRMQTNGILLDKIPTNYLNEITKILVSIDGDKKRTDYNRGIGIFDKVISNIKLIRKNNYNGEIVARMTISPNSEELGLANFEFSDIYEQVLNIINLRLFDSIHWQLDAGFFEFDFNKQKVSIFFEEYNKSIDRLIGYWINEIKKGNLIRLYPFIGIINSLLNNEKTKLRCGAGYEGYAITTDGKVIACPIMNCIEDFKAGDLDSELSELKKFDVSGRCLKCDYKDLCGGRCLYWNKAELWPKEGDDIICNSIKHLIDRLKEQIPIIKDLINKNIVKKQDFSYEKYFGPEIIP